MSRAIVKFPYEPNMDDELRLAKGDIVVVTERSSDGWWRGEVRSSVRTVHILSPKISGKRPGWMVSLQLRRRKERGISKWQPRWWIHGEHEASRWNGSYDQKYGGSRAGSRENAL